MTPPARRVSRPERRVWQLTAVMAATACGIAGPDLAVNPQGAIPSVTWFVLLPLFALAEVLVIHLPAERSSHSLLLREIPAVAGLAFLAPQQYVTAYVLGAGLALALWSRVRGLKLAFNVSMLALEASLGSLIFHAVAAGASPVSPRAWLAAAVAVLTTDLLSAAAVTTAISLTDSRFDPEVMREAIRTGIPAAMVNICVALLVVTLVVASPTALPLLGALAGLLVVGYRIHVRLARGHARLQTLYQFVGSTGHQSGADEVLTGVLSEAAQLLRATTAELVVLPTSDLPGRHLTWHAGTVTHADAPTDVADSTWWSPALRGEPVLLRHEPVRGADPVGDGPRDGLAVPLRPEGEVAGVLLVTDRTFEEETFGEEDLRVFETVGAHTAVALDKAHAVDRLKRIADERAHEALHDPLTGLPNRRAFLQAVRESMLAETPTAVLLLDLDDFKDVNDTLGHSAGDQLLTVTGGLLSESCAGMVSRLGGDEFAVLLRECDTAEAVAHAERLHAVLSSPIPLVGVGLTTSASIGVTTFHGTTLSADEVLAQADVAMYAAKADRAGVRTYRPEDGHSTARRLTLAGDLKTALLEGTLDLYFQPQADTRTGEVTGFEALLRWQHPQFGFVPPPEIVAVAHRTGLVHDLTGWVLHRSLEARQSWADAGHDLDVSVNVTPADVADPRLVDRVASELLATGTPPASLVIEITESDAMRDPERSLAVLTSLQQLGVRLSIDDFGTGHSSLSYLDRLPVHEVKIDRSFVIRLEQVSADSTIVRATISLAHDLGLRIVAEGVETDLTTTLVAEMGCDLYQGYGLARPMPGADVLGWLALRRAAVPSALPAAATPLTL